MRRLLLIGALAFLAATADPYLWLEDIDGERALAWVREQNERTRRDLASRPEFGSLYDQALAVLNSKSRVPTVWFRGDHLYNLWRDDAHPRGLLRRTTLEHLTTGSPRWETVLDIDRLARDEGRSWVFSSMTCLPPAHTRCLVALSPGGGDAVEIREFDARALRFLDRGFFVPVGKTRIAWMDDDTVFIGADLGGASLTRAGYPRTVRRWTRGTPLEAAPVVHEVPPSSVGVLARRLRTATAEIDLITESLTTWTSVHHQHVDGRLVRLELPETAVVRDGFQQRLIVSLVDEWAIGGEVFPAGSVVAADLARLRGEAGRIDLLVAPTESTIVDSVAVTDHAVLVTLLENVRGRLWRLSPHASGWRREIIELPDNGAVSVMTARARTDDVLVLFESFVVPPTLFHLPPEARAPRSVLRQEPTFDGSRMDVAQHWTASADGTRIPYFVVAPADPSSARPRPVHMFSYGGFRNALVPSYSGTYESLYGAYGRLWLERGGVFVLANIRGGGEFGPSWHTSVLRANRHKVLEDFEAVAADLARRGIGEPGSIGIEGRSQGGLLTLSTMVRRPELYGAVVSGVPLADMRRYHRLLAGASWMAEYGDPDDPDDWAFLSRYSPYQNFRADVKYPPVFVYGSMRDDRVHPGHGRKAVARLQALGHAVWYYENIEGGHGGSSTNEQLAYRLALSYTHLWRHLGEGRGGQVP